MVMEHLKLIANRYNYIYCAETLLDKYLINNLGDKLVYKDFADISHLRQEE